MGIKLISEQEKLVCRVNGATLWYRRVPSYVQQQIETRHTKRGVVDQRAVVEDVIAWAVLDWDQVTDTDGKPVPFHKELLALLPESAKADLIAHLYESDPTEAALGNSGPGSNARLP